MTASELGLVHLDLKPGNIVLDGQHPRIIDWGLSRTWNASEPGDQVVRGTPFYAGPERIVSPHAALATPLTDLYGVGATFYWMLVGEAPLQFEAQASGGGIALETYRDLILSGVRPRLAHELVAGVLDRELSLLIDRWLSYTPSDRAPAGTPITDSLRAARDELATLLPSLSAANVGLRPTLRRHR